MRTTQPYCHLQVVAGYVLEEDLVELIYHAGEVFAGEVVATSEAKRTADATMEKIRALCAQYSLDVRPGRWAV